MSLIKNIKARGFKDILNFRKIKIYFRYRKLKALKRQYKELVIPEYLEQMVLRMQNPGCRECIEEHECVHCHCKTPENFYDKHNECSLGNWQPMYPPNVWQKFRHRHKIDQDYLKQIKKYGKIIKFKD